MVYQTGSGEYEPYTGGAPSPSPDYPQEVKSPVVTGVKVTGKNLIKLNLDRWTEAQKEELKAEMSTDGKIILNFTSAKQYNLDLYGDYGVNTLKIDPNKSYTISSDVPQGINIVCRFDIGQETLNSSRKSAVVQNKNYLQQIFVSIPSGIRFNGSIYILLEYGATATEYEPYKEKSIPLSVPVILRGIPSESGNVTIDGQKYLSDYIGQKEGVYGVFRKISLFELESEKIIEIRLYKTQNGCNVFSIYHVVPDDTIIYLSTDSISPIMCNCFNYHKDDSEFAENNFCCHNNKKGTNFVLLGLSESFTVDEAKNYIKSIEEKGVFVTFWYVVEEETFEALPEPDQQALKDLKTFYPSSIISWETEDGVGAWTRAEIIHDPTNYIDEKLEQITSQQTALQTEILKIGGSI